MVNYCGSSRHHGDFHIFDIGLIEVPGVSWAALDITTLTGRSAVGSASLEERFAAHMGLQIVVDRWLGAAGHFSPAARALTATWARHSVNYLSPCFCEIKLGDYRRNGGDSCGIAAC